MSSESDPAKDLISESYGQDEPMPPRWAKTFWLSRLGVPQADGNSRSDEESSSESDEEHPDGNFLDSLCDWKYETLGIIGRGSFGSVEKIRCKVTGLLLAMKRVLKAFHEDDVQQEVLA